MLKVKDKKIRQALKINGIQIRKEEVKLSLSADEMILYIETPKDDNKIVTIEKSLEILEHTNKREEINILSYLD